MSGAAKVNSRLPEVKEYIPPTTVHINLKKHPGMEPADIGKAVHFQGHGIVRSIHKDEREHRMEIDVKKIKSGKAASQDSV